MDRCAGRTLPWPCGRFKGADVSRLTSGGQPRRRQLIFGILLARGLAIDRGNWYPAVAPVGGYVEDDILLYPHSDGGIDFPIFGDDSERGCRRSVA